MIQARLTRFKDQLMEVKTNREYQAMQKEIAGSRLVVIPNAAHVALAAHVRFDGEEIGWTDARLSQSPYAIFDFQELKTVWHPMGM